MRSTLFLSVFILLCNPILYPLNLSLEDAKEYTRQNSESIRLKLLEVEEKQYALKEAEALRFPEIDVQVSATYMTDPPEGLTIPEGSFGYLPPINSSEPIPLPGSDLVIFEDPENTYFKITTTLTQPIFTWGKINNAIKIARDDVDVSELTYAYAIEEVSHELSKIYFSTVFVDQTIVVLKSAKAVLSEILADREESYDEGLINLQEVLEAGSNLAAMEAKYIQAIESYKSGIEALCFFTGLTEQDISLTTSFRDTLPDIDEQAVKKHTLLHSHDISILRKKLDQALTYLNIEKGSDIFRPDFSFILSLDVTGDRIPGIDSDWIDFWDHNITFTLGTQVKLFDGGKSGVKIKQAEKTEQMAETGLMQLEKALALSVRKAIQEVKVAYYAILEKDAKFAEIEEQYKNAKVSYENDLLTREEERGARILLYTTELEHIMAKYKYQTALAELEFLSGMKF